MLSIIDFTVAFPGLEQRIEDAATELALSPIELKMFRRFYGFERFSLDHNQPLFDLINTALGALVSRQPSLQRHLQVLAHCHTLPSVAPFGKEVVRLLRERYFDHRTEIMSVTMNQCATGISILGFMDDFLSCEQRGVILIGEKAFHRTIRLIENTTIMGEAATAMLIGHGVGILEYIGGHTSHEGGSSVISGHPDSGQPVGFGRNYFDFMVRHIKEALSKQGFDIDDVRHIFPHNVNIPSWHQIVNMLSIPRERVHTQNVHQHGHCFGADPFINLLDALGTGHLMVGDTVLLISAGLGATVSTALVRVSSAEIPSVRRPELGMA
jgi:3-oxoacyl-[acyl-carrier-protein] synthase-3